MNQTLEKLKDIEKNGYQIDFGDVFNQAFENYKKIALYAGIILLIFFFLSVFFGLVSFVSFDGMAALKGELSPEKFNIEKLPQQTILIIQGIMIFFSCLFSPFQASFLKMADHGERDEAFSVSNLFYFYKLPYLIEIIASTFLISTFNLAQSTLLKFVHLELLGILITYFILFITFLSVPLIIFGKLKAVDSIKYSIIIIMKQPLVILGLLIISIIGSAVGIMGCCFGIFFTMPIIYSMTYTLYKTIIGIDYLGNEEYKNQ
jgi:hypothetical protein